MPMIVLTVPPDASSAQCEEAERAIVATIQKLGIKGGISFWPIRLAANCKRLLLEFKTRQSYYGPELGDFAHVLAEPIKEIFGIQVEAVARSLDPTRTGLYITEERKK